MFGLGCEDKCEERIPKFKNDHQCAEAFDKGIYDECYREKMNYALKSRLCPYNEHIKY